MATQKNNRNNGNQYPKRASVVFQVGDFVVFDGAGRIRPVNAGGVKVQGISNEQVLTTDADYATNRPLNISEPTPNDEFVTPVITGTATAGMVGLPFDVDPTDPRGIDVSGAGTDVTITEFIDASTVVVKIN